MRTFAQARPALAAVRSALPPARAFGPAVAAAPATAGHDFARVAVSAPFAGSLSGRHVPSSLLGEGVIQRTIRLNGKAAILDHLKQGKSERHRGILDTWHNSNTVHDFEGETDDDALNDLHEAVGSASAQPTDVPALYSSQNLKFLTRAGGREPTLYFGSADGRSGRIRQQHPAGPKVASQVNKRDYFFEQESDLDDFDRRAMKAWKRDRRFNPRKLRRKKALAFSSRPRQDAYHYEVTYKRFRRYGRVRTKGEIEKLHSSQGRVDRNKDGYNDERIRRIYHQATGHTS